jgi:hypothetical protein
LTGYIWRNIVAFTNAEDIRKGWFQFFFYSNEHLPIHVHVRHGGGEAVFVVEEGVELRESQGLNVKDLGNAQSLAEENKSLIIKKWNEHLGRRS